MKEIALQLAAQAGAQKLNILREYIQNEILFILQKTGSNDSLALVGGTALRFLYGTRRFSEDLDFSARPNWRSSDLKNLAGRLLNELEKSGYDVELTAKDEKTVERVFVRLTEILQEAGLSQRRGQKLSINIEIDANPPAGWVEEKTIVNLHMPILLRHYDKPSLFAAKIAAFLTRPYTKGRDVYDLVWLRSKWKELLPNLTLFYNALAQKARDIGPKDERSWVAAVSAKAADLDWDEVVRDVLPFLEDPGEATILRRDNFLLLYGA
jgi:predicted nucleotidyltransferase component of viral defense system